MGKKNKLFSPRPIEDNDLDDYKVASESIKENDKYDLPEETKNVLFNKIAKKVKQPKPVSKGVKIELKQDKNDIDEHIYYYKGSMLKINIQGTLFAQWCPTFVPLNLRNMVKESDDFEQYTPGKWPNNGAKQSIGIVMPSDLENFIFALTALERVRQAYPMCGIDIVCAPNYKKFLPSYCNHVPFRQGRVLHYRFFDLSENKLKSYWLTEYNQAHFSKHILFIRAIGLYLDSDKNLKPELSNKKRTGSKTIFLHSDDALYKESKEIIDSSSVSFRNVKDFDVKEMAEAKCLISTCDNQYLSLAGYLGLPSMVIMNPNILKHQNQLKMFNVNCYSYPTGDDTPKAVSRIREFITNNGIS